jgi:hypothetical protein
MHLSRHEPRPDGYRSPDRINAGYRGHPCGSNRRTNSRFVPAKLLHWNRVAPEAKIAPTQRAFHQAVGTLGTRFWFLRFAWGLGKRSPGSSRPGSRTVTFNRIATRLVSQYPADVLTSVLDVRGGIDQMTCSNEPAVKPMYKVYRKKQSAHNVTVGMISRDPI